MHIREYPLYNNCQQTHACTPQQLSPYEKFQCLLVRKAADGYSPVIYTQIWQFTVQRNRRGAVHWCNKTDIARCWVRHQEFWALDKWHSIWLLKFSHADNSWCPSTQHVLPVQSWQNIKNIEYCHWLIWNAWPLWREWNRMAASSKSSIVSSVMSVEICASSLQFTTLFLFFFVQVQNFTLLEESLNCSEISGVSFSAS